MEQSRSSTTKRVSWGVGNDFSRRRRRIQQHVKNPGKRVAKLAETRGGQRNRVRDELHKLSAKIVRENPDTSFIFEDLRNSQRSGEKKWRKTTSRKLRTYLNRWPYRTFQSMIEYKSCRGPDVANAPNRNVDFHVFPQF